MEAGDEEDLDLIGRRRIQPPKSTAVIPGKAPVTMPADPGPVSLWLVIEERWGAFKSKSMLVQDLERLLEKAKGKDRQVRIRDKKGTEWNYDNVDIALRFIGVQARRGVRMTTAARKPLQQTWQEIDEDDGNDGMDEQAKMKASRQEWDSLAREVNMKQTIEAIASGRRSSVVAYDDVADEEEADDPPQRSANDTANAVPGSPGEEPDESGAASVADEVDVQGPAEQSGEGPRVNNEDKQQGKRGGKRKPGSQKRREAAEKDEDGQPRKKRREEEDEERWMKLKLEGEEKPKRIDSTRLVSYFDFDAKAAASVVLPAASSSVDGTAVPDFRASVVNLWADDSDDEEE